MLSMQPFGGACQNFNNCRIQGRLVHDGNTAVIGDSLLQFNGRQCSNVADWLSLFTGKKIKDLSVGGSFITCPLAGCEDITTSYHDARDLLDLKRVIVNGGANDLFWEESTSWQVEADIKDLLRAMLEDGVKEIVYVRYYEFRGIVKFMNPRVDGVMVGVKEFCETHEIKFIDLQPIFKEHPEYFFEGIHPNEIGSARIAKAILENLD